MKSDDLGKKLRCGTTLAAAMLTVPVWVSPALAQTTTALEEIIVTAQRRAEVLEDVPMTVSVLSNEQIAASGVTSLRDIANVTTGFQLGQGGAFPQPAIRGVTTVINGTFENNVAVYVDGLYQPATQTINIDLPNVQSVQVLKGPQGTLYGRNATGGAILLNTITPGDVWEGKAELTYARFDDRRIGGYVAGPISDRFGVSLSGYTRESDGYVDLMSRTQPGVTAGDAAPLKQDSVRLKLAADLTEDFQAIVGYNYTRVSDPRGNLYSPLENVNPVLAPAADRLPRKLGQASWDIDTTIETKQHEGSLTLEWLSPIGTLKSITGYADMEAVTSFDFDGSYLDGNWSTSLIEEKTFQQSFDYIINAIDKVDLVVGATYFHDELEIVGGTPFYVGSSSDPGFTELPLSAYIPIFNAFFDQKKKAWATYLDISFRATDALTFTVGGRYSKEKQEVSGRQEALLPVLARPQTETDATFSKFTPRASIRYELAPRTNVYASYSKGFRSGAFNSQIPANPLDWRPADQETIDAYEIGFKTAGNRYRLELAAFYYDYQDLQVSSTVTGAAGNAIVVITNAPEATIEGAEISFDWEVIDNLTLRGGATYLHARFGDNFLLDTVGVDPNLPGINSNADPLKTFRNVSQLQDLSDLPMTRAPDWSAHLGATYVVPSAIGELQFTVNAKYTDEYVATNPAVWGPLVASVAPNRVREQRFTEGSYTLLNASITWTHPNDNFYARLWGNNLTDERYRLHYTGNANWGTYSPMAEPRTYGITVGYRFAGE